MLPVAAFSLGCAYAFALVDCKFQRDWRREKEADAFSYEIRRKLDYMPVADVHQTAWKIARENGMRVTSRVQAEWPTEECVLVMNANGTPWFLAYHGPEYPKYILQPHMLPDVPEGPYRILLIEKEEYRDEYPYA